MRSQTPTLLVPLAPLLAAATTLAVVANFSFQGVATDRVVVPAVLVGLVSATICLVRASWRALALAGTVFAIPCLHFLVPLIVHGAHLALVDAGDYGTYAMVGSWLMYHPITQPAEVGAGYNLLQYYLLHQQQSHWRLGALFLLSLFSLATGREIVEAYTLYCAVLVGLQSLAVYAFALVAFPRLRSWLPATVAVIFGVSPVPVWAAYASFLPQTLGLAFLVGGVAVFISGMRQAFQIPLEEDERRFGAAIVLVLVLLLFGAWSVYPEAVPIGFAICGLFLLFLGGTRLFSGPILKRLVPAALAVAVLWVLLSPQTFVWSVKGLVFQLAETPHGEEQLSTPLNLFRVMILAAHLPLRHLGLPQTPLIFLAFGYAMLVLGIAGLIAVILIGDRRIAAAVLVAALLLMASVAFRYRFAAYGWYAQWPSLYSWNLFKAAQFLAPFMSVLALGGLLLAADKLTAAWKLAVILLVGIVPLGVAMGQDRLFRLRLYIAAVDPDLKTFLQRIPRDGRLLLDLNPNSSAVFSRFTVYTLLRDGPFISTRDVVAPVLSQSRSTPDRVSFFSAPVSYVLSEGNARFTDLPVLDRHKSYRLLDARQSSISFPGPAPGGSSVRFTSDARGLVVAPGK